MKDDILKEDLEQEKEDEIIKLDDEDAQKIYILIGYLQDEVIPNYEKCIEMLNFHDEVEIQKYYNVGSEEIQEMIDDIFYIPRVNDAERKEYYKLIEDVKEQIEKLHNILDEYYYPFQID